MIQIDGRLVEDSIELQNLELCQLRLMRDGDLDWFILVPLRENVRDWCDLTLDDQKQLTVEIDWVCKLLRTSKPYKINVASLGNVVEQLHIHVIARNKSDRAWPRPVWGTASTKPFDSSKVNEWKEKIQSLQLA